MIILDIVIMIFIFLEAVNVSILYFAPEFKYGNGVAVFKHWEDAKADEKAHLYAKYMKNWVAGSKLIFIVLLVVIFFTANETTKLYSVIAMIPAIATYYLKLHPIMVKLDDIGEIKPKGYSKALISMITGFILMFIIAVVLYLL